MKLFNFLLIAAVSIEAGGTTERGSRWAKKQAIAEQKSIKEAEAAANKKAAYAAKSAEQAEVKRELAAEQAAAKKAAYAARDAAQAAAKKAAYAAKDAAQAAAKKAAYAAKDAAQVAAKKEHYQAKDDAQKEAKVSHYQAKAENKAEVKKEELANSMMAARASRGGMSKAQLFALKKKSEALAAQAERAENKKSAAAAANAAAAEQKKEAKLALYQSKAAAKQANAAAEAADKKEAKLAAYQQKAEIAAAAKKAAKAAADFAKRANKDPKGWKVNAPAKADNPNAGKSFQLFPCHVRTMEFKTEPLVLSGQRGANAECLNNAGHSWEAIRCSGFLKRYNAVNAAGKELPHEVHTCADKCAQFDGQIPDGLASGC